MNIGAGRLYRCGFSFWGGERTDRIRAGLLRKLPLTWSTSFGGNALPNWSFETLRRMPKPDIVEAQKLGANR